MDLTYEAIVHGTPDFPISMFPHSPWYFSYHYHKEYEILLIEQGNAIVCVGGDMLAVKKGDLLFLDRYKPHYMINPVEGEEMAVWTAIVFDSSAIGGSNDFCRDYMRRNLPALLQRSGGTLQSDIDKLLEVMESSKDNELLKLRAHGYLLEILFELLGSGDYRVVQKAGVNAEATQAVHRAIEYMETNYGRHLSIEEIALTGQYSVSHFISIFKQHTGITPIKWLMQTRVKAICKLLCETYDPITELAGKCGFDNISHFNRVFRKHIGMTPSVYRKRSLSPQKLQQI
ncbi:MAG: AraC family transcriptional regulator [Clostridiales bacterium]|nr:AraC family transcriptional regulator [Clostridiales bacterium]